jgi:hypothetical protein
VLTFSEFVDYLLWTLYRLERDHGVTEFVDLNEAAGLLHQPVPSQWVVDAAKVLESRGLVRLILAFGGYAGATLTGEGRIHVEDRMNQEGHFMHALAGNPFAYVRDAAPELAPPETLEEQRAPAFELIGKIETEVRDSPRLTEPEKTELLSDVTAIRAQLRKHEPNRAALAALLGPMSEYSFLASPVSRLIELLNPSNAIGY